MKKLTDEELSRVLTAHEAGGLVRGGNILMPGYPACLAQVAKGSPTGLGHGLLDGAAWFDSAYRQSWTVGEFLAQLEARGLA